MSASDDVTPFRIDVPDADLDDLRDRLRRTRWPEQETVGDWSQGVPLAYIQDVCRYWADEYDWRAREAGLNRFAQYRTTIDGLGIHFVHVRSPHPNALPLVMTHGWPGSIAEFQKVIGPLADPPNPSDAFHVVCPSLPGYGFSDAPAETGWGVERIASAWATLMARLGYDRYVAQGGDWGAAVSMALGGLDTEHCAGIHVNLVFARPGEDQLAEVTDAERQALEAAAEHQRWGMGYSTEQSTRPQTLGYGLADSPAGQAAWIIEKFWAWTDCGGHPENSLSRDEMLDDVMLYWLPNCGASSARLYWESFNRLRGSKVTVPATMSIFPKEIFRPSRRWAERVFTDIRYWNEPDRGGHFAAFEQPELFVSEVRAALACFR